MILIWLPIVIAYALVWLVFTRSLAGHFAWDWARREHDNYYKTHFTGPPHFGWWLLGGTTALLIALAWPVALIFAHFPHRLKIGAEREADRLKMVAHIKQLEKEAGL